MPVTIFGSFSVFSSCGSSGFANFLSSLSAFTFFISMMARFLSSSSLVGGSSLVVGQYIPFIYGHTIYTDCTILPSITQPGIPFGGALLLKVLLVDGRKIARRLALANRRIRWNLLVFVAKVILAHQVAVDLARFKRGYEVVVNHAED